MQLGHLTYQGGRAGLGIRPMCWLGWIRPHREEGPALGVSTPQVCIRVVPGKRELLLLLLNIIYLILLLGPLISYSSILSLFI